MKKLVFMLCFLAGAANASTLRVACDGPATGAEVSVNGKFRGECPLDIQVGASKFKVTAVKTIGGKKETFSQELRLGEDVVKRIEVVFGNVAAPVAAPAAVQIDPKVMAAQRYQVELDEYNRSINMCLPKHATELSRLRRAAEADLNAFAERCKADAREWGKPSDWSWNAFYRMKCGELTIEARRFDSDRTQGERELGSFEDDPKKWCAAQFTPPRAP